MTTTTTIESPKPGRGRPRTRVTTSTITTERLSALQARLGLSAQGMAVYLGVPLPTWRNWRDGHREPPAVVGRLLEVLGTVEALAPAIHDHLMPRR
jgi:DNA-binding transcriptional regulator YiaG